MDNEEDFEELKDKYESDLSSFDDTNISNENSESDLTNGEMIDQNPSESSQTDSSNLNEKLEENKNKKYEKANNDRDAYQKKLDNGKNYYDDKLNKNKEDQNKLKDAQEQNNNRRDSAEKRLEQAKQNRINNKNKNTKSDLRDAKQEDKEAKKESKKQEKEDKNLKKEEKSIQKDSKKADRFKKMHPIEAAKMAVKNKVDKIKKIVIAKVAMIVLPIILGLFLIFFVIELILGPLMEVWGHIDEAITKTADFSEKVTNFYNGFGFQDTKEAFYEEINELYDKYDSNLDIPLLLSTLFYTEGMGYDTEFGETEAAGVIDGSVSGSNGGVLSVIREYLREKFDEAQQTVDENGLVYNVGKIYRLRKLARNQFNTDVFGLPTRKGTETTMNLGDFLEKYGSLIAKDFLDVLQSIVSAPIVTINHTLKELWAWIVGSEYQGDFFDNTGEAYSDTGYSILSLFGDMFYGIADITGIKIELGDVLDGEPLFNIEITIKTFVFDEDNYTNYLMNYYLDNMPEFDKLLPDDDTAREEKKKQIIEEIYQNRELFKDIFLQYMDTDSEAYTSSCVGGIDTKLVSELQLPVSIPEGTAINFTNGETSFGIRDGKNHNGVDLNTLNSGVNEGDSVYAIASGEVVESLPDVSCNTHTDNTCEYSQGAWVKIKHNIVIDNNEYNFYSVYMHLQTQSGQPSVGTRVNKGDIIGKIGNTGDSSESHLHFEFREDDGTEDGRAVDPTNLFIPCSLNVELVGDTNEEKIWNWLLSEGYTKIAAAGIMGNWQQESGFLANNLENGANSKSGLSDEQFTSDVDNHKISKEEFKSSSRFGIPPQSGTSYDGLKYGYGLAQWTDPGRKETLYNYWSNVGSGISIGDLGMQLNFFKQESKDTFSTLADSLNNSTSPESAASIFVSIYEGGTCPTARKNYARQIYTKYSNQ